MTDDKQEPDIGKALNELAQEVVKGFAEVGKAFFDELNRVMEETQKADLPKFSNVDIPIPTLKGPIVEGFEGLPLPEQVNKIKETMREMGVPERSTELPARFTKTPQADWDGESPLFEFPIGTHVLYPEGTCHVVINGAMRKCTIALHDKSVCSQCGKRFYIRACGPTHAMVWGEMRDRELQTEKCHCGRDVVGDPSLGPASMGLCPNCLPIRCDAYPLECPYDATEEF